MEEVLFYLQRYDEILIRAIAIFAGLIVLLYLARILRQIKRLNRSLQSITNNIQAYFDVIMQEEVPKQDEEEISEEQALLQRKTIEDMETFVEQERRKQEDEEVFNAVLQEYFS